MLGETVAFTMKNSDLCQEVTIFANVAISPKQKKHNNKQIENAQLKVTFLPNLATKVLKISFFLNSRKN